jgi:hypothetical protein
MAESVKAGGRVVSGVRSVAAGPDGGGHVAQLPASGSGLRVDVHHGSGEHVDQQQPVVGRVPERALAVEGAGLGELLRLTHI